MDLSHRTRHRASCKPSTARRRHPCRLLVRRSAQPVDAQPALHQLDDTTGQQYTPEYWVWKRCNAQVQFIKAGSSGPPLLLLHGFGVGCYHYERNIPALAQQHRVWAVDLLGQGSSWPDMEVIKEQKLLFSIDTWMEQLRHFIEENIQEPVYVVGNSLGGYLAVMLAANHPELCKGIVLLNATPFWSFRPPAALATGIWQLLPDGTVPVSAGMKQWVERLWWNNLRSPEMIRTLIQTVYANKSAADEQLVERIVAATQQQGALDAFVSIVFSPRTRLNFDEMLDLVRCRIIMMYGQEDPWVKPLWGQRLKRRVPRATYLAITPAGHCPHHEVPETINQLLEQWIRHAEGKGPEPLELGGQLVCRERDGHEVTVRHLDGTPQTLLERADYLGWQWLQSLSRQRRITQAQSDGLPG